jgi:hypothetical protein
MVDCAAVSGVSSKTKVVGRLEPPTSQDVERKSRAFSASDNYSTRVVGGDRIFICCACPAELGVLSCRRTPTEELAKLWARNSRTIHQTPLLTESNCTDPKALGIS